jgi:hypothetical protein
MKYQLVIQFQASSLSDLDQLTAFEDALSEEIGDSSLVDGHDFGSGELNIFVLTDLPRFAFRQVQEVVQRKQMQQEMRAAYRDLDEDSYVILWPPDLIEFKIA